jgi:hypothetical protein
MSDTRGYSDGGPDDIPRTFRREREARERAAATHAQENAAYAAPPSYEPAYAGSDVPPGVVKKFKVPFFSLMMFFMKAVLAAIPALILLSAILWGGGQLLTKYMPWLLKMKIVISFPN